VTRLWGGFLVGLSLGSLFSVPARASDESDETVADALYRDGQRLIAAGQIHEACAKFAESQRLDPAAGTLIATAACHEREGKLATAMAEFSDAVSIAQHAHEAARAEYAKAHAGMLDKVVYRLTIRFADPPEGLSFSLDDRALGVPALGTAIPLDPGHHRVQLALEGHVPWTKEVEATTNGSKDELSVTLSDLPPLTTQATLPLTPLIVGGAGAVALLAGGIMVAVGTINGNDAAAAAKNTSGAVFQMYANERSTAVDVQASGFVIGGLGVAALAVGGYLYYRDQKAPPPATSGFYVFPRVAPSSTGLVMGGRF
jgi:hypothetical protein